MPKVTLPDPNNKIEVDIADLEFDLPPELDNINSLELFEQQVVIAFGDIEQAYTDVNDAYTRAAYHIHMILEYGLWKHRQVEDSELPGVYKQFHATQEDYLADLAGKTMRGFAVSTAKSFHTAFKIARHHLGYSKAEIEARGVYIFKEISKYVEKEHETGKPLRLKDGSIPPGGKTVIEHLRDTVESVTANPERPDIVLKPKHFKLELQRQLAPRTPRVEFRHYPGRDMTQLTWEYERYNDDGMPDFKSDNLTIKWSGDPPTIVMEKFYDMLKIDLNH